MNALKMTIVAGLLATVVSQAQAGTTTLGRYFVEGIVPNMKAVEGNLLQVVKCMRSYLAPIRGCALCSSIHEVDTSSARQCKHFGRFDKPCLCLAWQNP